MLRRCYFLMCIWLMLCTNVQASPILGPIDTVDTVAQKLFDTLKKRKLEFKKDPQLLRAVVEQQLMPYIDTPYASYKILGSRLQHTTKIQRDRFVKAFSNYLTLVYSDALLQYDNETYRIVRSSPPNLNSNIAYVFVYVDSASGNPIKLEFVLRKNTKKNKWLIFDFLAENVSLLNTKQAEFSPILVNPQEGVDKLTLYLEHYYADRIAGKQSQEPWKNGSK